MKQILHAVHVHAAPTRVYRALTTRADLAGWWTKQVEIDPEVNGVIRFRFAGDFHPEMRQTTLEPDRRVEWRCVSGHANWQDNTFTFGLDGAPRSRVAMNIESLTR